MSVSTPNIRSREIMAIIVAMPEKKLTFFPIKSSIGVINTKYRLTALEIMTASRWRDPIRRNTLKPVSSTANTMPFFSVSPRIWNSFLTFPEARIRSPMRFVTQTKANVETVSGTFRRKTY